jgi:hypothetical protein
MNSPDLEESKEIIGSILTECEGKTGIICLNCLSMIGNISEIKQFLNDNDIFTPRDPIKNKMGIFNQICKELHTRFHESPELQTNYENSLDFIGSLICSNENFRDHLLRFDFIAKYDLIDTFADFCADNGDIVYDISEIKDYPADLFIIKEKPSTDTEAAFLCTGNQADSEDYDELLLLLKKASKIANGTVFVTTPNGANKIGLRKLVLDLKEVGTALYIVDPFHNKIWGICKGERSKTFDKSKQSEFIKNIPREPIRAPSRLIMKSEYKIDKEDFFKSQKYMMYELFQWNAVMAHAHIKDRKPRNMEFFRNLLIIEQESGLLMMAFSSQAEKVDDGLVSGFLQAMDGIMAEVAGSSTLKEINYEGFYIIAAYGKWVKIAIFLSGPPSESLKQCLAFFVRYFETHFKDQIELFLRTRNTEALDSQTIRMAIKNILEV